VIPQTGAAAAVDVIVKLLKKNGKTGLVVTDTATVARVDPAGA
jgi:hypothetical protein